MKGRHFIEDVVAGFDAPFPQYCLERVNVQALGNHLRGTWEWLVMI